MHFLKKTVRTTFAFSTYFVTTQDVLFYREFSDCTLNSNVYIGYTQSAVRCKKSYIKYLILFGRSGCLSLLIHQMCVISVSTIVIENNHWKICIILFPSFIFHCSMCCIAALHPFREWLIFCSGKYNANTHFVCRTNFFLAFS